MRGAERRKTLPQIISACHLWRLSVVRLAFFYDEPEKKEEESISGTLAMDHVTFSYPGQTEPVLKDVSILVEPNENVRILGANGSGKSTVMSLLAGLFVPQKGTVCVGASLSQIRKAVALCDQGDTVFSGTVEENLFICEEKRDKAGELLAKMGFTKPLSYPIEPEGKNLSPGERKKLLLVRALMKDAVFLALDEPLNHLDKQGAAVLSEELHVPP